MGAFMSRISQEFVVIAIVYGMSSAGRADEPASVPVKNVAAAVTVYRTDSHADVLVSRILEGYAMNDSGPRPGLRLASLYIDQVPENDIGRALAKKHGVRLAASIEDALTLGSGKLAVDGVLIIAEHGDYPLSETGQMIYPKRRMFTEVIKVFEKSSHVVPVFSDKHLADNWTDAKWIYDTA